MFYTLAAWKPPLPRNTATEAVAALAREPGGYLIAADAGLGSVPLEVRMTRRWREPDSNHRSAEKETAVERGPAADHRRLAR